MKLSLWVKKRVRRVHSQWPPGRYLNVKLTLRHSMPLALETRAESIHEQASAPEFCFSSPSPEYLLTNHFHKTLASDSAYKDLPSIHLLVLLGLRFTGPTPRHCSATSNGSWCLRSGHSLPLRASFLPLHTVHQQAPSNLPPGGPPRAATAWGWTPQSAFPSGGLA